MFSAEVFISMFEAEEDWAEFARMIKEAEIKALETHEDFLNRAAKGLDALFIKMADVRTKAAYEADEEWRKTADYKEYASELARVDASARAYREWKARRKEEDLDTPLCDRPFYDTKKDAYGHQVPCEKWETVGSKIAKEIA